MVSFPVPPTLTPMVFSSAAFGVPLVLAVHYRLFLGAAAISLCLATSLTAHSRPHHKHHWYHYIDYVAVVVWIAWLVWMVVACCGMNVWVAAGAAGLLTAVLRAHIDRQPYLTRCRQMLHVFMHLVVVVVTVGVILCAKFQPRSLPRLSVRSSVRSSALENKSSAMA